MLVDSPASGQESRRAPAGGLTTVSAGAALLAAFLVVFYLASVYGRFPGDVQVSSWVQSARTPWLDDAMVAVSPVPRMVAPSLAILLPLALAARGLRVEGILLFLAMMASFTTLTVAKAVVARPRPAADLVEVLELRDGYSFPSGHILHYTVLLGLLAFVLSMRLRSRAARLAVHGAVLAALLSLGFMRLYLGVHWASDVVAGYATGAAIVAGTLWVRARVSDGAGRPAPVRAVFSALRGCVKLLRHLLARQSDRWPLSKLRGGVPGAPAGVNQVSAALRRDRD